MPATKTQKLEGVSLKPSPNFVFDINALSSSKQLSFLNGLVGFNYSHLNAVNNRCELIMLDALFEEYLKKPSVEELIIDAKHFHDAHSFNGIHFCIAFLQDCVRHVVCRPLHEDTQKRCKRAHALKTPVACAVGRKWAHEVAMLAGCASEMTAWKE